MKTPIQELIEYSDSLEHITHEEALHLIYLKLRELLEKEKQMIIEAYFADDMRGGKFKMTKQERAEQYYNETFKQ